MERFVVTYLEANNRLDKALSLFKSDISRSYIAKLIEEGQVLVNDKQEKSSYKVKENDVICLLDFEDKKSDIKEEDIPLLVKRALKEGNPGYPVPKIMNARECEVLIRQLMNN
jgi:23S rRNA-/tRNA-specific pseudouridylate synthase